MVKIISNINHLYNAVSRFWFGFKKVETKPKHKKTICFMDDMDIVKRDPRARREGVLVASNIVELGLRQGCLHQDG